MSRILFHFTHLNLAIVPPHQLNMQGTEPWLYDFEEHYPYSFSRFEGNLLECHASLPWVYLDINPRVKF